MSLKIFPYSLVRYAGLHHQTFDQLQIRETTSLLTAFLKLNCEKEALKNKFCDALYPIISIQKDDKVRQQMINLKRQVFNNKKINSELFYSSVNCLPVPLRDDLQQYLDKSDELSVFWSENTVIFEEQQNIQRKIVQEMSQNPELQNGLLLSSPLLYEQLNSFIKKDPNGFKQKEQRVLFSLLRYLSRMAYKTSPFSSFTYTGLMTLEENTSYQDSNSLDAVMSNLKLNNAIFEYLKKILKKHPLLNEHLLIKLNITAEIRQDKICFLSNFNNVEAFQQINANGLQLKAYEHLRQVNETVSLSRMILHLNQFIDQADRESIKIYLLKLVEAGMIEMDMGFSGMDQHWDKKLLAFLKNIKVLEPSVKSIITLFESLQQQRAKYPSADPASRYQLLQDTEKQLNSVFAELQQEAGLSVYIPGENKNQAKEDEILGLPLADQFVPYFFSARHIFYEDCFTGQNLVLDAPVVKDFITKTDQLIGNLLPLDVMRKERNKMIAFFLDHYQLEETVNLADFYKDYYFYIKKPEKEKGKTEEEDFLALQQWKKAVLEKIAYIPDADENLIRFDHDFFSRIPGYSGLAEKSAMGMFVQFTEDQSGFSGVINALLPGMGKVSGRFLSLFDHTITENFVRFNENLYPGKIKVELNDASTFNANIHPPLLEHELELPGGNHIYTINKKFNIHHLKIKYNQDKDALTLHQEGSELYSYDLSLESFYNRSNLYQLLAHFNPDARVSLQPFIQLVDQYYLMKHSASEPDLFTLPRIVYENNVVIRRKTWRIKTEIIPQQDQHESDFGYFIKINNWLERNKIPQKIFMFLRKRAYQQQDSEKKEGLHDDYKPQYLSFEQPLLIGLFKKLLLRAGTYITFEEVYPQPEQNRVREYLIQWYND